MSKKMTMLLYGNFPKDWPVTNYAISSLEERVRTRDLSGYSNSRRSPFLFFVKVIPKLIRIFWEREKIDFIFVGFGGKDDLIYAKMLGYALGCPVVFHAIISTSNTLVNYKSTGELSKNNIIKLIDKEKHNLKYADVIIYDTNEVSLYYQKWLNESLVNKVHILPLCSDPAHFQYHPVSLDGEKLRVIWYGQASKLHGIEKIIQVIRECSANREVEFTLVVSIKSLENVMGTTIERLSLSLIECQVRIIPWEYDHDRFSVDELNELILKHQVVLGVFNDSEHAKKIWANKEVESLLLGRLLVTSSKVFKESSINAVINYADDVSEIKQVLLDIATNRRIDHDSIIEARKEYLNNYKRQIDLLLKKVESQK